MHTHELGLLAGSSEPCNWLVGFNVGYLENYYNLVKQALDGVNLPMSGRALL